MLLLLTAIVWGSAFAAQRVAAQNMGVYLFNGLRFCLGGLALLPLLWWRKPAEDRRARISWWGIALAGVLIFAGATFQQAGLQYTTAANAGFITGLYVVIVPLLLALGGAGWPRPAVWLAVSLATLGLFLLSTGGQFRLAPGDGLELAGALLWALHILWISRLVQRVRVMHIAVGQYLVCGLLSLGISLVVEDNTWAGIAAGWWPIVYTGFASIALGYTLQAVAQRVAPPSDVAILLSGEAAFAALFGWLLLAEELAAVQILGCGLMLGGMLLAQLTGSAQADRTRQPNIQ